MSVYKIIITLTMILRTESQISLLASCSNKIVELDLLKASTDYDRQDWVTSISNADAKYLDSVYNNRFVIWCTSNSNRIYRSSKGQTQLNSILLFQTTKKINGITFDWVYNNIYWTDDSGITVLSLEKEFVKTIINTSPKKPQGIVIDPRYGWIYWSDVTGISKVGSDGTRMKTLVTSNSVHYGIAIDYVLNRIFWADNNGISSCDFEGSTRRNILGSDSLLYTDTKIAILGDNLIWTNENEMHRTTLSQTSSTYMVEIIPCTLTDIKLYNAQKQPTGTNYCGSDNGGCSHLCLAAPQTIDESKHYSCGCPDNMKLLDDETTCVSKDATIPTTLTTIGTTSTTSATTTTSTATTTTSLATTAHSTVTTSNSTLITVNPNVTTTHSMATTVNSTVTTHITGYICDKGPNWNTQYEECQTEVTKALQLLMKNINSETYEEVSSHLNILTSNPNKLQATDIDLVMQIMEILANTTMPPELALNVTTSIMNTISNLLEVKEEIIATSSTVNNVPSRLIKAFDNILQQMQSNLNISNSSYTIQTKNIVAEVKNIDRSQKTPFGVASQFNSNKTIIPISNNSDNMFDDLEAAIILPNTILDPFFEENQDLIPAIFLILRNSKLFVEQPMSKMTAYEANVPVVSAVIGNGELRIHNLLDPIVLLFKIDKKQKDIDNFKTICSYWNFTLNSERGGWLNDGCIYNRTENNSIICHCNHLTYFSALIHKIRPGKNHERILTFISYIGCGFSALGLCLSLILDWIFRGKTRRTQMNEALLHLKISLLCVVIIFMTGINANVDSIACKVVAMLLHFFLLVSFLWMLVEAFLQYLNLVKVIKSHVSGFLWKSILVAYGTPFMIVSISAVIDIEFYKGTHFCWLEVPFLYYGFIVPLGLIIFINLIVFCLIIKSLYCTKSTIKSTDANEFKWIKFRGLICTFFLLGLTWLFAGFSLAYNHIVFQYMFCIFNTLQGFVISIFHFIVMKNKPEVVSYFQRKSKLLFSYKRKNSSSNKKSLSYSEEAPFKGNSYKLPSFSEIDSSTSEFYKKSSDNF